MLDALIQFMGCNQMTAYLVMMAARLVELRRVLKPTGSLYLHCDPTASHYLKIILDVIFSPQNYRNEIVWKRQSAHSDAKNKFADVTDNILFYVKSNIAKFNPVYAEHDQQYIEKFYRFNDQDGKGLYRLGDMASPNPRPNMMYEWLGFKCPEKGWRYQKDTMQKLHNEKRIYYPTNPDGSFDTRKRPALKRYLDEQEGSIVTNIWSDINSLQAVSAERLGYPTQKPVALLKRILLASSAENDIVLDPFSGCGTAIAAAEELHRRWIGIDITHLAIAMHKVRLAGNFNLEAGKDYDVVGEPADLAGARKLASDDRYQFQWWALSLLKARPVGSDGGREGKKGSDRGIDGIITFKEDAHEVGRIIIQVKSGRVNSSHIRDLVGTLNREKAAMALFVTLEPPTADMIHEANQAGLYYQKRLDYSYPKVQIITIESLLNGEKTNIPILREESLPQAPRVKRKSPENPALPGLDENLF